MKTFTTQNAIVPAVLCRLPSSLFHLFWSRRFTLIVFGTAGSSNNNHEHGRIISISELFLTVTPLTVGLAMGFTFLFWKRK